MSADVLLNLLNELAWWKLLNISYLNALDSCEIPC